MNMSNRLLHLCMTIIPPDLSIVPFYVRPNPDLKSDVNDEKLVKGLTALTFSPRGSRHKLCHNARVPRTRAMPRGHVLLADTIRTARMACSKSMSGKIVDLRCKLNPTFLGLRS